MLGPWVQGARPRTLPVAVVPVVVGTGVAAAEGQVIWWRAAVALVVSLALQVGTNYANDYSDGIRGTDEVRAGPVRLVASGLASPTAVRAAALLWFGIAAVAGLALAVVVGPELLVVGAAAIAAGWFYTGGPRPYGYAGYGELFVFVFFGLVATAGTAYVQLGRLTALGWAAGVPIGLFATALLVVNNLRDIPTDAASGKRTLAVRLGPVRTRRLYSGLILWPFVFVLLWAVDRPWLLLALASIVLTTRPRRIVRSGAEGPRLIAVLGATTALQSAFGVLLTVGLVLS